MTLPTIAGVQSRIHTLPDRPPFMTVYDLAEFYEVKPDRIMQQMRRNQGRFPEGYTITLTEAEIATLVMQNALPNRVNRGSVVVFTKKGSLQLSSVLTGPVADAVSVVIIDAFDALETRQLAALRREWAADKWGYIGKSVLRQRIMAAAEAGASYNDLWGRWSYSHRVLTGEIEAMRVRGYIGPMVLTPPLYILREIEAKKAHTEVHVEDARQMRLGLEG